VLGETGSLKAGLQPLPTAKQKTLRGARMDLIRGFTSINGRASLGALEKDSVVD
jgi:hypothetical protein